jgi:hypothetical protein
MSFEVTVTPTVYNVEVEVNPSVQPFDVVVEVGNVPDLHLTTLGDSGASTFDPLTGELNIPEYTLDGLGGVPESRTLTVNGTTQDLSADRTFTIPAPDPVTIGSPANGLAIDGSQILTIGLASSSDNGALSSTDWSTFNAKQPALGFTAENVANKAINLTSPDDTKYPTTLAVSTALAGKQDTLINPITGTGTSGQVSFFNGTTTQTGDNGLFWDNVNKRLGIETSSPSEKFSVLGGIIYVENNTTTGFTINNTIGLAGAYIVGSTVNNFVYDSAGSFALQARTKAQILAKSYNAADIKFLVTGGGNTLINTTTDAGFRLDVNGTARVQGDLTISDTRNIILATGTGTKIGTATSQKLSFWNATPNVQPTTAITAGAFVANTSGITDDTATFGGYTIGQVVAALRRIGALA